MNRCSGCGSFGLCALDCHRAPWNELDADQRKLPTLRRFLTYIVVRPIPRSELRVLRPWPKEQS